MEQVFEIRNNDRMLVKWEAEGDKKRAFAYWMRNSGRRERVTIDTLAFLIHAGHIDDEALRRFVDQKLKEREPLKVKVYKPKPKVNVAEPEVPDDEVIVDRDLFMYLANIGRGK